MRRDGGTGRGRVRDGVYGGEQGANLTLQRRFRSGVEAPAYGGRTDWNRCRGYFKLWPIARPNEISPLSIRTLNPQSGLLHTHAL